jgi:hypothetical protein
VDGRDKRSHDDVGRCGENDPGSPQNRTALISLGIPKLVRFA